MKNSARITVSVGLSALALMLALPAFAFTIPVNDGYVTDTVHILTEAEEAQMEAALTVFRTETSNEIAVVIVPTLDGTPPVDAAVEILRTWQVGGEEHDNGIVILVGYDDHEIFITTGYGLEGAVPDIIATGIAETDMAPAFREGRYFDGIMTAIDSLKRHIGGEYTADRYAVPEASGWDFLQVSFFFIVIILEVLGALLGRTKSWWLGGVIGFACALLLTIVAGWWLSIPILTVLGLLFDYIVSKNYKKGRRRGGMWIGGGGFSGGGGSSSGGGFGGFGGGSGGGGGGGARW